MVCKLGAGVVREFLSFFQKQMLCYTKDKKTFLLENQLIVDSTKMFGKLNVISKHTGIYSIFEIFNWLHNISYVQL